MCVERVFCRAAPSGTPDETLRLMLDILHITQLANIDLCSYNCEIKRNLLK